MGHPLQMWLAVLVLAEWCTLEEAEKIRAKLTGSEIPSSVAGVIGQFETTLAVIRENDGGR